MTQLLGASEQGFVVADPLRTPRPATLQDLASRATRQRGDVRAVRAELDAAKRSGDAAGRWWVPALGLSGGVKTVSSPGGSGTGYAIGITLEIPILDRRQRARQRAAAAGQRAHATLGFLNAAIPGQVRSAHAALEGHLDRLQALEADLLPRADKLVGRAGLIFREGEGSVVDFLDARRTALEVRAKQIELRYRAKASELELWRALGARPDGGAR